MKTNLKRKGIVRVNETLLFYHENTLKCFFSNFYPYDIFSESDIFNNRMLSYHCISEFFDEVEEGQEIPQYEIYFKILNDNKDNKAILHKVEKIIKY